MILCYYMQDNSFLKQSRYTIMAKSVAIYSKFSTSILAKLSHLLPSVQFTDIQSSECSRLKEADIVLADFDLIGPHLYNLPKVQWIQGTWAGIDLLLPHIKPNAPPKFPITRTSGDNFGQLMGEYVIGNIIFWERNYFQIRENQKAALWDPNACPHDHRSFKELTIGILGVGSIGNTIAKTLKCLGATVYGFGKRDSIPLDTPEYQHLDRYYNKTSLKEMLANVDYFICVLPNTQETTNLLGNGLLQNCLNGCKKVMFVNIGRGNVITEAELVEALDQKWIAGAILDVFEVEPLPKSSRLWDYKNVFITPHISGNSRVQDVAEKFKINFEHFVNNESLVNQIDFIKGY